MHRQSDMKKPVSLEGGSLMLQISYAPLWETLAARDMKKVDLTAVISSAALKKMQNHELVSLNVLMRISEALDVPIEKIIEFRRV